MCLYTCIYVVIIQYTNIYEVVYDILCSKHGCSQCARPTSRRLDVVNSVSVQLQHVLW